MSLSKLNKLVKNIINDVKASEDIASESTRIQKKLIDQLKQLNHMIVDTKINSKELKIISLEIKDKLRRIELDPLFELESEKELSKLDSANSNQTNDHIQKKVEQKKWDEMYQLLINFMNNNYHCCLRSKDVYKNKPLGQWVDNQRKQQRKNLEIYQEKYDKLNKIKILDSLKIKEGLQLGSNIDLGDINNISFEWSSSDANWSRYYRQLKKFYIENKHCLVPSNYKSFCGEETIELGTWVLRMRQVYRDGLLSPDRVNRLKAVYFCFSTDLNSIIKNQPERQNLINLINTLTDEKL